MNKITKLKQKVELLYLNSPSTVKDWSTWIYKAHVLKVVKITEDLTKKYGVNKDLAVAGALLHDVADALMRREEENHESVSYEIAKKLMQEAGFSTEEIQFIIIEIIRPHSCKSLQPQTMEGKILATADAIAHLTTDIYEELYQLFPDNEKQEEYNAWVLSKLERDFHLKIKFEDQKLMYEENYKKLKKKFSNTVDKHE